MAFAASMTVLIVVRCLVGAGIGMGFICVSMYIAEIAPSSMRGGLMACEEVALNVGWLLGYTANLLLAGVADDWRWMLGLGCVFPVSLALGLLCIDVPESPRWLLAHGRSAEAETVAARYLTQAEVQRLLTSPQSQSGGTPTAGWSQVLCSWGDPPMRKAFSAALAVACAQTACGSLSVSYYSTTVLKETMSEQYALYATFLMGVVKMAVCLLVVFYLESFGRRPMLLASTAVTALACACIAYAFENSLDGFMKSAGFWLFMAGYSIGQGPLTFVYLSETFGTEVRAKGMGLSLFCSRSIGCVSTLFFPSLVESLGAAAVFELQTVVNVVFLFILYALASETHGRSLEDADMMHSSNHRASA